eukprot:2280193-Pleurochrysis_carterae.AAC.1
MGRLDVLVVPEATQNGYELAKRLGVVQPGLRPVASHPRGEHRRPHALRHLDVAYLDRAHEHQPSLASLHGRR